MHVPFRIVGSYIYDKRLLVTAIQCVVGQCLPVISVYVRFNTQTSFRGKYAAICSYTNVSGTENNQSSTK